MIRGRPDLPLLGCKPSCRSGSKKHTDLTADSRAGAGPARPNIELWCNWQHNWVSAQMMLVRIRPARMSFRALAQRQSDTLIRCRSLVRIQEARIPRPVKIVGMELPCDDRFPICRRAGVCIHGVNPAGGWGSFLWPQFELVTVGLLHRN